MTFGWRYGSIAKVDQKTASDMVARVQDVGVNLFNTADQSLKGLSEEILRRADPMAVAGIFGRLWEED